MKVRYSPAFLKKLKKQNVRIRKAFKETILLFSTDPFKKELDNHALMDEWEGYRSIHIRDPKNDWSAVYKEIEIDDEIIARFIEIGTHKDLFR